MCVGIHPHTHIYVCASYTCTYANIRTKICCQREPSRIAQTHSSKLRHQLIAGRQAPSASVLISKVIYSGCSPLTSQDRSSRPAARRGNTRSRIYVQCEWKEQARIRPHMCGLSWLVCLFVCWSVGVCTLSAFISAQIFSDAHYSYGCLMYDCVHTQADVYICICN